MSYQPTLHAGSCPVRRTPFHIRGGGPLPRRGSVEGGREHRHINYTWESLDEVTFPRQPPGPPVAVAFPNTKHASALVDPTRLLATKALRNAPPKVYSHCAHYYFNGVCELGADCNFIHVVVLRSDLKGGAGEEAPSWTHAEPAVQTDAQKVKPVAAAQYAAKNEEPRPLKARSSSGSRASAEWWYHDPYTAAKIYV